MPRPKRTFVGVEGEPSTGLAGADGLRTDLDNVFRLFDPASTFPDGTQGGIGQDNIKAGTINKALMEPEYEGTLLKVGSLCVEADTPSFLLQNIQFPAGGGQKVWTQSVGFWDSCVIETNEFPLFQKQTSVTPEGEEEHYTRYTQFVRVRCYFTDVYNMSGTRISSKSRISVAFPASEVDYTVLWESPSFTTGGIDRTLNFTPFTYIPYSEGATMKIKWNIMANIDGGLAQAPIPEFSTKINKTLMIIPLGGV